MSRKRVAIVACATCNANAVADGMALCAALPTHSYEPVLVLADEDFDITLRCAEIEAALLTIGPSCRFAASILGYLELRFLPHSGNSLAAVALASCAVKTRHVLSANNIATPLCRIVDLAQPVPAGLSYPCLVSAIGSHYPIPPQLCRNDSEFDAACSFFNGGAQQMVIEHRPPGTAFAVAVFGDRCLGAIESSDKATFIPPRLPPTHYRSALRTAARATQAIGCDSASVVHMVVTTSGNEYVTAIDAACHVGPASPFALIAQSVGVDFGAMCHRLMLGAFARSNPLRLMQNETADTEAERYVSH